MKQTGMNEFVEGFADIGGGAVPMAEGVAGELNPVALEQDALGAVVGTVMAVFGGQHVGHQPGCGAQTKRGWRGGFQRDGIGITDADVDGAGQAADENNGRLIVETVGGDALDFAEAVRILFDLIVDDNRLADFKMRDVAGFARGTLFGGDRFSRRSGVCGLGGGGFFCGIGIQQEFELGRVERLALLVEELPDDGVDTLAQQLVLDAQQFDLGPQAGVLVAQSRKPVTAGSGIFKGRCRVHCHSLLET